MAKYEVKQIDSKKIAEKYGLGGKVKVIKEKQPEDHKVRGKEIKGGKFKNWWMTGK